MKKLIRLLDQDGLKKTLGIDDNPTFLLRPLCYYRTIEKEESQDPHEGILNTTGSNLFQKNFNRPTRTLSFQANTNRVEPHGNKILISCWSLYKENDFGTLEFQRFYNKFNPAAIIVSTDEAIKNIIAPHLYSTPVEQNTVTYYSSAYEGKEPSYFCKQEIFKNERE